MLLSLSSDKYIFTYFGDNQSIASTVGHLTQKEKLLHAPKTVGVIMSKTLSMRLKRLH